MIGELIAQARKKAGLTQQKLGEMCGYTGRAAATVVQKWEHDVNPVPLVKLRALSKALNIPLESLIP